jgi:5-oxopent-3-ene-1,2,5-tricarboxylate decarboxylase / 2-hydroxyhepta-2,4-diene-1,7-dioate isomerase
MTQPATRSEVTSSEALGMPRMIAPPYWPAGTVYGTLLNFRDEVAALGPQMAQPPYKAPPQAPVLFVKTANTWSRSGTTVPVPARVSEVEVGATIAMVVGTVPRFKNRESNLAFSQVEYNKFAIEMISSYVLMNDFSIPHTSYFRPPVKFKCLDGFLGIGSQRVPRDQIGNVADLMLEVRINDQLCQTVNFSHMVRSSAQLLADVSEFMTLREGDVLMLGCDCLPGGGRPLARIGDRIDISVPGVPALGVLSNTLVAEVK